MKKITVFFAALLAAVSVCGAELKIAVVDMRKVFQDYEKTKIVEKKLQEQMDTFREYSTKINAQIQSIRKEFEETRNQAQNNFALTPAEQKNKEMKARELYEQLAIKESELKSYAKTRQEQIRDSYEKLRSEILTEIKAVISSHAQMKNFTLVLDQSGFTSNEISAVVYSSPNMDITEMVLEDLNRLYRKSVQRESVTNKNQSK